MALLPEVRGPGPEGGQFVPALSVFVAFVLVVLSVGVFVEYIHRMAQSIRAIHVIRRVADETRAHLEELYPQALEEPRGAVALPGEEPDHELPHDRPPGVLVAVHQQELTSLACDRDVVIALVPRPGDFVPRGAPLFRVWGRAPLRLGELRDCVEIGGERTPAQDAAFGFRQLVDIARPRPSASGPGAAIPRVRGRASRGTSGATSWGMREHLVLAAMGAAGGALGTALLQAELKLAARLPEPLRPVSPREDPGRRIAETVERRFARRPVSQRTLGRAAQALHWAYGIGWGALLGLAAPRLGLGGWRGALVAGAGLGAVVWAVGYLGWLPATRLTAPVQRLGVGQAVTSLLAHVDYGILSALPVALLAARRRS